MIIPVDAIYFKDICKRAANCLEIRINTRFYRIDYEQCKKSLTTLVRHLKSAKEKFDKVVALVPDLNQKWIGEPFRETQLLLLDISNYLTLLDREHDIYDENDTVVKIGDLVAVNCTDENNKPYKHYGIVVSSSREFRIAHFFTGETVKAQNSIVEKGFGYIHEVRYSSDWLVQEHLPKSIPYSDVEDRIKASRKIDRRVWNKVSYNCEHWAREMFSGKPKCTQLRTIERTH